MGAVIKGKSLGARELCDIYIVKSDIPVLQNDVEPEEEEKISPEEEAAAIIAEAEERAVNMVERARSEVENIRSAAYKDGFDKGYAELSEEKESFDARIVEIESDVERQLDRYMESVEPDLLSLSLCIAKQIIKHEIEAQPDFVMTTIKAGLRQIRERSDIRVRVNPNDYELVRSRKEEIAQSFDGVKNVEVVDDRRVDEGGCVIESTNGELDARIESQLREAERALLEAAHDGRNDADE